MLLAACVGAKSEAKNAVLKELKDPDSAKFGEFTQPNQSVACLTVNSRNAMGGYTGDQQAIVMQDRKGRWSVLDFRDESHEKCIDDLREICSLSEVGCLYSKPSWLYVKFNHFLNNIGFY